MTRRFVIAFCLIGLLQSPSFAAIVTGDIQILGFRSNKNDDQIAFVNWVDVSAGATISFTDSGFFDDGTVRDAENNLSWTATSGLAAGTVVVITTSKGVSSADTGTTTGSLALNPNGDQVFAGTTPFPANNNTSKPGSPYNGMLLTGLDFSGKDTFWNADALDATTSALPSQLSNALFNIAVPIASNGQYAGTRTGLTVDEFKIQVDNPNNWEMKTLQSLDSIDFSVVSVPEASAPVLLAFLGAIVLLRRKWLRRSTQG